MQKREKEKKKKKKKGERNSFFIQKAKFIFMELIDNHQIIKMGAQKQQRENWCD
jgi:hypothetical protein